MADTEENTETETTTATDTTIDLDTSSTVPASSTTDVIVDLDQDDEDAKSPAGEKPTVAHRASIDDTDQISPSVKEEETINLDTIADPERALTAENIFGEPRGELGPVIMNRVFQDLPIEVYESTVDKYETKAVDLHELLQKVHREQDAISNELKDMRTLRDDQKEELVTNFTEMLAREREIGHGLVDSHTGKTISDKLIDRLSTRQQAKSDEIAVIRLHYIKRRERVKEIEAKIKSLETIDGKLHLMDFEQLRMENQTYTDKIEERDEELMRLRERYSHAMQSLAHIREKINIIQVQTDNLHDEKISEQTNVNRTREMLNDLKLQRDTNRAHNVKLKNNTGILTYPKLLLDMEQGMNILEQLREQLEKLKIKNKLDRKKLLNIRVVMEKTGHAVRERKYNKKQKPCKAGKRYCNTRPKLAYPIESQITELKAQIIDLNLELDL